MQRLFQLPGTWRTLSKTVGRFANIAGVVLALIAGLHFPVLGDRLSSLIYPLVSLLIYFSLRDVEFDKHRIRSNANGLVIALLVSYIAIPLVAVGLTSLSENQGLSVGIIIMSTAPSTAGSAIVWTRIARSDVQSTTIISVVSVFLAPIVMPLLLLSFLGRSLDIAFLPIFANLGVVLGAGVFLKYALPSTPISEAKEEYATQVGIALLIYISVSSSHILDLPLGTIASVTGITMAIILFGLFSSIVVFKRGLIPEKTKNSLFFSSTLKNLGVSLLVATSFSMSGVVTAIVIYYVVQQVTSSLVVDVM